MGLKYKVVNEENLPVFYAFFSSLAALKLKLANYDQLPGGNTEHYDFSLDYTMILPAVASLDVETEQEVDGRWIAEIPALPGVLAYGDSLPAAVKNAQQLASRVMLTQPTGGFVNAGSSGILSR
jgi:predicted RNase H-like HicB family nuclease